MSVFKEPNRKPKDANRPDSAETKQAQLTSSIESLLGEETEPDDEEGLGWVYGLLCAHGKYYVGKTTRPVSARFWEHNNGFGSAWTALYPPLQLLWSKPMTCASAEDLEVVNLMKTHGVENVRGGTFSKPELPAHQVQTLGEMLHSLTDSCFICGGDGHFAADCKEAVTAARRRKSFKKKPRKTISKARKKTIGKKSVSRRKKAVSDVTKAYRKRKRFSTRKPKPRIKKIRK